jgi:hypothetical protein
MRISMVRIDDRRIETYEGEGGKEEARVEKSIERNEGAREIERH